MLWFNFKDASRRLWSVFLEDPVEEESLVYPNKKAAYRGICMQQSQRIVINAGYTEAVQYETVVHELLHASYGGKRLSLNLEEHAVSAMEGNLAWALRSVGFKLPIKPTGYKQLHRRARRHLAQINNGEYKAST